MTSRNSNSIPNHNKSIPRICPTIRTNGILGSSRNYKLVISNPIYRKRDSSMCMRSFLCGQRNPTTIRLITLPNAIPNHHSNNDPPAFPTPKRIK